MLLNGDYFTFQNRWILLELIKRCVRLNSTEQILQHNECGAYGQAENQYTAQVPACMRRSDVTKKPPKRRILRPIAGITLRRLQADYCIEAPRLQI